MSDETVLVELTREDERRLTCLQLELPEAVWDDIKHIRDKLRAALSGDNQQVGGEAEEFDPDEPCAKCGWPHGGPDVLCPLPPRPGFPLQRPDPVEREER